MALNYTQLYIATAIMIAVMIKLKDITLRRGVKVILQQANLTINPGENVALVGRNGIGKTSLFAMFNQHLLPDGGELEMPPHWLMAQVAQEMPQTSQNATDFVIDGDPILLQAKQQLAQAESSGNGDAIANAHMLIDQANGYDARARAQAMLLGLGFKLHELENPVDQFSGGWRMRLQLARALMCPADLMLLDEPTNHLDLDALVWLEAWLQRFNGTLIVISHDREFLDAVTQVTVHMEDEQLTRYTGGYSAFEEQRAQRILLQQAAFSKQQEKIEHLQKFIDRFKAKATKAKQAQSRVKALERMERIAPVITASSFEFEFKETGHLPSPMLRLRDIACGYSQETPIIQNVSSTVLPGQRIGILGANGQGKSTLVKTIAGEIPPISGIYTQGKGLSIGYFAQQELDILHADDSPLQHMLRLAKEIAPQTREQELRSFLGGFRFVDDMVNQAIGTMSGGEKARLVLAMLVWQRPNLLLLDEPTNHLDLITREALAMAINQFEGSVMLVSHDRAMLRSVCDEFWLVAEGGLKPFDGDIDDYQQYLLDFAKQQREALKVASVSLQKNDFNSSDAQKLVSEKPLSREERKLATQRREELQAQARPLKKQLSQVEKRISEIDAQTSEIETQLATPDQSTEWIVEAGKQLKQFQNEKDTLEEQWLEISEQIQTIEQA